LDSSAKSKLIYEIPGLNSSIFTKYINSNIYQSSFWQISYSPVDNKNLVDDSVLHYYLPNLLYKEGLYERIKEYNYKQTPNNRAKYRY
jgi:hypothetical protein